MQALHLRVEHKTIEAVMSMLHQISHKSEEIEIINNLTCNKEQIMIFWILISFFAMSNSDNVNYKLIINFFINHSVTSKS